MVSAVSKAPAVLLAEGKAVTSFLHKLFLSRYHPRGAQGIPKVFPVASMPVWLTFFISAFLSAPATATGLSVTGSTTA